MVTQTTIKKTDLEGNIIEDDPTLEVRSFSLGRPSRPLFSFKKSEDENLFCILMKEELPKTNQSNGITGPQEPLLNICKVLEFKDQNVYHSACIDAKVNSTVGVGFETEETKKNREQGIATIPQYDPSKVDEVLNPLCDSSFLEVVLDISQDFEQTGNGYMEVIRAGNVITGLHHIPVQDLKVYLEDSGQIHYVYDSETSLSGDKSFARFGDKEDMVARNDLQVDDGLDSISEVIAFRKPSSRSKFYGFPNWIAGVPCIELVNMLTQFKFDFFLNRGVPEFMLFVTGTDLDDKAWEKIENAVKANIGQGNSHKTMAINIPGMDVNIQVERLGMDSNTEEGYSSFMDSLGPQIVSAHGVPPLLAGIQIPGKLGANNELPNALMAFQALQVGQTQRLFSQILGTTLGSDEGVQGLEPSDFIFNRITDQINLGNMDTVSRMRTPVAQAEAEGRNVEDGLRD